MKRPRTPAQWTFVVFATALLPLMILSSFQFGVTWDEKSRHKYGELIWEFYGGLRDRSSFTETGGHLYGGLFDGICAGLAQWVPINIWVLRHIVNATFGWVGVLYSGRLAARLFGTWAGVLAMVLLASSPRYFADSMNNPKDLPFAAMSVVALYYISTISPKWPYFTRATALKIAVALGLALNIRAGALLYVGYMGLLVIAYVFVEANWDRRRLAITAGVLAAIVAAVMLIGTIFWPWAQGAPLWRPIVALFGLADFPWAGGVLFNGKIYSAPNLPWYYALWWLVISTPPVVIAGAALSAFATRGRTWSISTQVLWGLAAFPVVLIVARDSTLYDGIRHILFIYPLLVILAAAGWAALLSQTTQSWRRWGVAVALALGLGNVLAFNVRFHPNETVYFNEIIGGPRGAFAKFEMDYWGNCVLEAVAWSAQAAQSSGRPVTISGNPWHLIQLDAERFRSLAFVMPNRPHDLDVRLNRGSPENMIDLAGREALYQVRTPDGAVLCAVFPGPAFAELQPHFSPPPAEWTPSYVVSGLSRTR
jgi:hypothetical protein